MQGYWKQGLQHKEMATTYIHHLWREANICKYLLGFNADSTRGKLNVYLV